MEVKRKLGENLAKTWRNQLQRSSSRTCSLKLWHSNEKESLRENRLVSFTGKKLRSEVWKQHPSQENILGCDQTLDTLGFSFLVGTSGIAYKTLQAFSVQVPAI